MEAGNVPLSLKFSENQSSQNQEKSGKIMMEKVASEREASQRGDKSGNIVIEVSVMSMNITGSNA
jgi:hypothetical protein